MLAFLKIDMLSVVQKIANAWEQVSPETLKKSWRKLISFDESSVEKNATCLESVLNNEFVEQFAALNIELTTSDIDGWFQADGPVYEHMDKQGIVDLVSAAEDEECDEEEDTDENTAHLTQKEKCPVSHAEAMRMFNRCPMWLRFQSEASVSSTSTLVRLCELAAEKRQSACKQIKIDYFFCRSADATDKDIELL